MEKIKKIFLKSREGVTFPGLVEQVHQILDRHFDDSSSDCLAARLQKHEITAVAAAPVIDPEILDVVIVQVITVELVISHFFHQREQRSEH